MKEINRKQLGRLGLSMAINYFTVKGYTVSIPINDTQWYDLIIEKDNKFYTVQCKATSTENKSIITLNLINNKKIIEIKNAHNNYITNLRHYLDKNNNRDLLLSVSNVDFNIKIWNVNILRKKHCQKNTRAF